MELRHFPRLLDGKIRTIFFFKLKVEQILGSPYLTRCLRADVVSRNSISREAIQLPVT